MARINVRRHYNIGLNDLISKFRYHKNCVFLLFLFFAQPISINTLHGKTRANEWNGTSTSFDTNHFILLASAAFL